MQEQTAARRAFARFGRALVVRPIRAVVAVALLAVVAVAGLTRLELVSTPDVFVAPSTLERARSYEADFGGDPFLVAVPGSPEELSDPEVLGRIEEIERQLRADGRFRAVLSPLVALRAAASVSGGAVTPTTPGFARRVLFDERGEPRSQVAGLLPAGHLLVMARLEGGLDSDAQIDAGDDLARIVDRADLPPDTLVTGRPYLFSDLADGMTGSMVVSGLLAVVLMIAVLYTVFPARWRLLALPVVVLGAAWGFGLTGWLGVPITLVTMAGLPVLIGLGADFAIQFHNRYEEEARRGALPASAAVETVTHIGPAVGMAGVASALGFLTLQLSISPTVKDFGVLLTAGVGALYLAALVVLVLLLHRLDTRARRRVDVSGRPGDPGPAAPPRPALPRASTRPWLQRAVDGLSRFARRRAPWVLVPAVVVAATGFAVDGRLPVKTDPEKMVPPDTPVVLDLDRARSIVGSINELPFRVAAADVTDPRVVTWLERVAGAARAEHPEILEATTFVSTAADAGADPADAASVLATLDTLPGEIRAGLISDDHDAASLVFLLDDIDPERVLSLTDELLAGFDPPEGVTVELGGSDLVRLVASVQGLTERRVLITLVGLAAVFVGLLLLYRQWRRAVSAVLPIVLVTGWSSGFLWVTGIGLNPFTAVLGALVIGIGTEFTILVLERYWEDRARGEAPARAMTSAVARVGPAVVASAATVAAGFGALIPSDFPMLREFGIVTVVDVALAVLAALVVVPPVAERLDRVGRRRPASAVPAPVGVPRPAGAMEDLLGSGAARASELGGEPA